MVNSRNGARGPARVQVYRRDEVKQVRVAVGDLGPVLLVQVAQQAADHVRGVQRRGDGVRRQQVLRHFARRSRWAESLFTRSAIRQAVNASYMCSLQVGGLGQLGPLLAFAGGRHTDTRTPRSNHRHVDTR